MRYIHTSLLFIYISILSILGCKPDPYTDSPASYNRKYNIREIVRLTDLTNESPNELWEDFFIYRGARYFWDALQQLITANGHSLNLDLENCNIPATEVINEAATGIMHYLIYKNIPIQELSFKGSSSISDLFINDCWNVGNELTFLSTKVGQLTRLTQLDLRGNKLNIVPNEIGQLLNLEFLYLSANKLNGLPDNICYLNKLQLLHINENEELANLPAEIGCLSQLTDLNLSTTKIKQLPTTIANLRELISLDLGNNNLGILPTELANFTRLKLLKINSNLLRSFPNYITNFTQLKIMDANNNQIQELPDEIGYLTGLEILTLASNNLNNISFKLGKISNLTSLNLSRNELDVLPDCIKKLSNLNKLNISNNKLKVLPAFLGRYLSQENFVFTSQPNPWLKSSDLERITGDSIYIPTLLASAYKQLPRSLVIICMDYIQKHARKFDKIIDEVLPEELREEARTKLLRQTCIWDTNIIYFTYDKVPFYLAHQLCTLKDLIDMPLIYKDQELYIDPSYKYAGFCLSDGIVKSKDKKRLRVD